MIKKAIRGPTSAAPDLADFSGRAGVDLRRAAATVSRFSAQDRTLARQLGALLQNATVGYEGANGAG